MANLIIESVSGYLRFQLIQVGLENRLFDVIEETIGKTTKQIANEANCDERYAEEWCQALALGSVLNAVFDNAFKEYTYTITGATKSALLELTPMLRLVNSVGTAVPDVCKNFSSGAPVFFETYCNVQKNLSDCLGPWYETHLKGVLERAGINNEMKNILDFGCGMGRSTFALSEIFHNSTVHGVDLDKLSIDEARKNPKCSERIKFHCQDASEFATTGQQFELVCFFVCLHDFAHPTKALELCQHLLTSDGKIAVIEMAGKEEFSPQNKEEFNSVAISTLHCVPASRPENGAKTGEDIGNPFRLSQMQRVAKSAGFEVENVSDQVLTETGYQLFLLTK
ncbi:unnamed protein product [Oikopleura dioica]|uniref:Uncharacterized protein n=1 Tax=Oikopleura dioica TaxID=34765 RepID=E4YC10_OIKDI|nr:unnamed protein product [Oikopleura dioica]